MPFDFYWGGASEFLNFISTMKLMKRFKHFGSFKILAETQKKRERVMGREKKKNFENSHTLPITGLEQITEKQVFRPIELVRV